MFGRIAGASRKVEGARGAGIVGAVLVVLLAVSPSVQAACRPNASQSVTNPGLGEQITSTLDYPCHAAGCDADWARTNPDALLVWTTSNAEDAHTRTLTWEGPGAPVPSGDDHGGHAGHTIHSVLTAVEGPQNSEILWYPCGEGGV
jgi:hypothetical protein